jgi:dihydroorotase
MERTVIKNVRIVNEGKSIYGDLSIKDGLIEKIDNQISAPGKEIDGEGLWLLPGVIDDQVHFREPGLTHKANIGTESRAAVAGGVTSFMEMPNTKPSALTQELLQDKYDIAAGTSPANYSFFMGAGNDNIEEVLKTDKHSVCGVKVFMGSSTGNMLVDNRKTLENIFSKSSMLIATHCEDEATVRANTKLYVQKYGDDIPIKFHPIIRDVEACYLSSSMAVELAKKHHTRLHILHISTDKELSLFESGPIENKRITSEVCVHHLFFDAGDYEKLGTKVKCNPAIKEKKHRLALFDALLDDKLDIIATDHAPHTISEKDGVYTKAPSGLPLVQHTLQIMLDFCQKNRISLERVVEKMSHAPAQCFHIRERGYIREGYKADLVLVDPNAKYQVNKDNLLYKCGWSPLEGYNFGTSIAKTFVNGNIVFEDGKLLEGTRGERMMFH